jgi:CheY-like chemotaxis protein
VEESEKTIMNQETINLNHAEILIVDDIPANLNVLCQTLEPEGYNIIAATSGERRFKSLPAVSRI